MMQVQGSIGYGIGWCLAAAACFSPGSAQAGTVELVAARPLDFGAIVVLGTGTKRITPDGTVSSSGVANVPGAREGPAEFTLTYRPDGRGRVALLQMNVAQPGALTSNGSTGTLAGLTTDLRGVNGRPVENTGVVRLPPCPQPACVTTIRIGGELSVSGGARQTTFTFPLQVTIRLLAEQ